ncbi:7,8-didemethyl-8-hydroxy-5-deazariboflavin synthase subunit CofG [Archaeoglobus profundus]|uniref:7,8-didemethyl-8-hydroxy-5-deazariboflavin synthase n=1 Tax=Archaeoglobus profundus (strain DSM 5631 / JCM 9629 / NBRC 100127 / Av18) TaxID=572546 RepID=D2RDZ7_ARCPA|nr:7,8-didemethyl-8-hydroxy-5-deazariboflavin synthase subunit CofG [Archaeoglobus profundus]ADB58341.1 Radical SAM domain protein [Archaeoglobus profundus DSM 5631]
MEIVTFSKNVFIPLTRTCRNSCAYCGFRKNDYKLMKPEDIKSLLLKAKSALEALFTFGEKPDVYAKFRENIKRLGYNTFIEYVRDMNKLAVDMGFLPHTNAGVLSYNELKTLKPFNASMGLMLEQAVELECHAESPGKKPEVRIKTIKNAGKLKIPFTTGILVGIGESEYDRAYSLEVIADIHANYGHIQEVIIQNFSPKPNTPMANWKPPSLEDMLKTVKIAREILPSDVTIQIPPNLVEDVTPFLKAGARDLGGISEVTPDYINPEHPWPSINSLKKVLEKNGFILRERLPIYPKFVKLGWFSDEIAELIKLNSDREGFRKA